MGMVRVYGTKYFSRFLNFPKGSFSNIPMSECVHYAMFKVPMQLLQRDDLVLYVDVFLLETGSEVLA